MGEHYFSPTPQADHKPAEFKAILRGEEFLFHTDAGVFSKGRLDPGTKLLINSLDLEGVKTPLDLGCGYGPLGLSIARELPLHQVYMSDINMRAVELAKENAVQNRISNVSIKQGDGFAPWKQLLAEGLRFDLVVTNPPLRTGKVTVLQLFKDSFEFLSKEGSLWVVIRTNQGAKSYLQELKKIFGQAEVMEIKSGYRVLKAQKL